MFYEAIFVPDGEKPFDKSIIHHPQLEKYTYHWGKEHDLAFIAETKREKVGLIWTRLFTRKNPGFGYFDDSTPELGMAVKPDYRNKGIGCMLLIRFFREMEKRGYKKISLSVDKRNRAVNLYKRTGFQIVKENESDFIMVKHLKNS